MPNNLPDQYAVFGNPIAHSKSPALHSAFANQCGQAMSYRAILADTDKFATTVTAFIEDGGRGANVTLPFKLEAFQLCTVMTARARAAGAVNTLRFEDGQIWGDNTDGCGLVRDITINAGISLAGKRILLLGAGGAARGALMPLLECLPSELVIANRSMSKAEDLRIEFQNHGPVTTSQFAQLQGQFDILINATSASISDQRPPIPDSVYTPGSLAYDMMYASEPTQFLQHAAQCQAQTRDGWGMLVEQAAEAFFVWRGMRPDTKEVLSGRFST
jgi:shikimate dehydrogenase